MKVSVLLACAIVALSVLSSSKTAHAQWQMPSITTDESHIWTGNTGAYYADISPSVSESFARHAPVGTTGHASCEVGGGFTRNYYFPAQAGQVPASLTIAFGVRLTGSIFASPHSNLVTSNAFGTGEDSFEFRKEASGMYGGYDESHSDTEYYLFDESQRGNSATVEYSYRLATSAYVTVGETYKWYEHYGNRAKVEFSAIIQ